MIIGVPCEKRQRRTGSLLCGSGVARNGTPPPRICSEAKRRHSILYLMRRWGIGASHAWSASMALSRRCNRRPTEGNARRAPPLASLKRTHTLSGSVHPSLYIIISSDHSVCVLSAPSHHLQRGLSASHRGSCEHLERRSFMVLTAAAANVIGNASSHHSQRGCRRLHGGTCVQRALSS